MPLVVENCEDGCFDEEDTTSRMAAAPALLDLSEVIQSDVAHECRLNETLKVLQSDSSVQVCTADIIPKRIRLENLSDKAINSLTGLHSGELLNYLAEVSAENCTIRKLDVTNQIIMTLMRIKLDLSFVVLGIFFDIAPSTVKCIFVEIITILAKIFDLVIPWVDKDEVLMNMPKSFSNYKQVRVVLDCTEVLVQMPKCLKCQIASYSHYYGDNTIKYMVGISPGGLITFRSKCYGGRASDSAIFAQSGLVHFLHPHIDKVMVDKGFLIDEICHENFIEIVRPPFLRNGKLSASDCKSVKSVARARVHVERMIQRLKIFKLLQSRVPWNLTGHFDNIMTVICGITNMSKPILADIRY